MYGNKFRVYADVLPRHLIAQKRSERFYWADDLNSES